MPRRLLPHVWPLLAVFVLGSLVLPAAHRVAHGVGDETHESAAASDHGCDLCAVTFAAVEPGAGVVLVALGAVGTVVETPRASGGDARPARIEPRAARRLNG